MEVWKTIKIFVSSTFKDLEIERDELAKIFKRLQENLFTRKIHLILYDLRWQERHNQDLVSWCLDLVKQSHYFVGILADRYGWCPPYDENGNDNKQNISITEMEIRAGLQNVPKENRLFYFTEGKKESDNTKVHDLKNFLTQSEETIYNYNKIADLGQQLESTLLKLLEHHHPHQDQTEVERYGYLEALEDIIEQKAQGFVGRVEDLQKIKYFMSEQQNICIIHGIAGMGKSSLLSHFIKKAPRHFPNTTFIAHFSSMTPDSDTILGLLNSLALQLQKHDILQDPPQNLMQSLMKQICAALESSTQQIAIVIDGVDEFSAPENLNLFLSSLPQKVKVVLSTRFLWSTPFAYQKIEIISLTEEDIAKIIFHYQQEHGISISENDRKILQKRANGSPLFLKVALDEVCNEGIAIGQMAETVTALFSQIVERLQKQHGKDLVDTFLGIICASRYGIMEAEIYEIIGDLFQISLSDIILLQRDLRSFVLEKKRFLIFFHPEFERSIKMSLGRNQMRQYHQALAQYFTQRRWNSGRSLSELPYQLQWGEMHAAALKLYADIDFLKNKCQQNLLSELLEDFKLALYNEAVGIPKDLEVTIAENVIMTRDLLVLLERAVEIDLQFISKFPNKLFQCLWNRGYWHDAPDIHNYYHSSAPNNSHYFYNLVKYWYDPNKKYQGLKCLRPLPERLDSPLEKQFKCPEVVWSLALHPVLEHLALGLENDTAQIWNTNSVELVLSLDDHKGSAWDVKYSSDGKKLAVANGRDISLWDIKSAQKIVTLSGHERSVTSILFQNKNRTLLSASEDKTIKIWDLETFRCMRTLTGHGGSIWRIQANDECIFSSSEDKTVKVWDLATGNCLKTWENHSDSVQDICIGKNLLVSAGGRDIFLWDVEKLEMFSHIENAHEKNIYSVAINNNDSMIVSGSYDKKLKIWNSQTGKCNHTYHNHQNFITNICITANGEKIISACYDKFVRIWNPKYQEVYGVLDEHSSKIQSLNVSPCEKWIATGSKDGEIRIWDVYSGQVVKILNGHEEDVSCLIFAKNNVLISGSWDGTIRIWNINSGECLSILEGHERMVETIYLSHDEQILVSAGTDQVIHLWDLNDLQILKSFHGHKATIRHLLLSVNNKTLVSLDDQAKMRIWQIDEQKFATITCQYNGKIKDLSFGDSENTITAKFWNNEVYSWNLEGKEISRSICTNPDKYQNDMFHLPLYNHRWINENILIGTYDNHLFILEMKK